MKRLLLVVSCLALLLPGYAQASNRPERPLAEPSASNRMSQPRYNRNEMLSSPEYFLWLANNDREAIESRKEYFKSLSEEERLKIKRAREIYQDLPDDKKRKLREEWDKKPPEEKANFRKWKDDRNNKGR